MSNDLTLLRHALSQMSDIATLTAAAADDYVKVAIELVSYELCHGGLVSKTFAECCKFSAKF